MASERATRAEKPSDLLLMFRLKGERPHKYRDNVQVHHTHDHTVHLSIQQMIDIASEAIDVPQIEGPEVVEGELIKDK